MTWLKLGMFQAKTSHYRVDQMFAPRRRHPRNRVRGYGDGSQWLGLTSRSPKNDEAAPRLMRRVSVELRNIRLHSRV